MQTKSFRWYDGGGSDALDQAHALPGEIYEEPDPRAWSPDRQGSGYRAMLERSVEFAAHDPQDIVAECEEQDQLLGLERGSTLELLLSAMRSTK